LVNQLPQVITNSLWSSGDIWNYLEASGDIWVIWGNLEQISKPAYKLLNNNLYTIREQDLKQQKSEN